MSCVCNNSLGLTASFIGGLATATVICKPKQTAAVCDFLFNNRVCKGALMGVTAGVVVSAYLVNSAAVSPSTTMANVGANVVLAFAPPIFGAAAGAFIGGLTSICRRITVNFN